MASVEVDAHGVAVVRVEGFGDEFEWVAGFEDGEGGDVGVECRATQRGRLQTVAVCGHRHGRVRKADGFEVGWHEHGGWIVQVC